MRGFLLDTNVLSELRKGERADAAVVAWFDSLADSVVFTSVLVTGEIRRGIELARRRDVRKVRALDRWLTGLIGNFGNRILPVDERVADRWGGLGLDQPLPDVDGLLAATALVHDLTLATRNVGDFARSGVEVVDPFAAQ